MNKLVAMALCAAFASLSVPAVAGVAPNQGTSQYERSGAKIAKPAPAVEEEKKANQEESKEPAK